MDRRLSWNFGGSIKITKIPFNQFCRSLFSLNARTRNRHLVRGSQGLSRHIWVWCPVLSYKIPISSFLIWATHQCFISYWKSFGCWNGGTERRLRPQRRKRNAVFAEPVVRRKRIRRSLNLRKYESLVSMVLKIMGNFKGNNPTN